MSFRVLPAFVVVSMAFAGLASASEPILPLADEIHFDDLTWVISSSTEGPMPSLTVEVRGTATFSNPCMAPRVVVKEILTASESSRSYRVLGASDSELVCTADFKPVKRRYVIDRFVTSDILPVIQVNGVAAHLEN